MPGQPMMPPHFAPFPEARAATGVGFSVTAFVLAAVAVLILPIVFGVAAIIFGVIARKRGERLGALAMRLAIVGTALGALLGMLFRLF
jgi:hypothetical protein